ncbi:hypothetical protein [Amycolatopsis magusensis]|uniref:Uncharacterized protein YukE n=1 Tax=Amycolatopsis magusensis TaxID=882444 RepID=A0ABS4PMD7_9PSEU|nr:hypothetical protein [Amycolatopsis magusensis]MBP2180508.1 uncharacterized protein YukE [Amycolatopsis magusensis]MDI5979450.1 hypothetical protein [Amycolatopsis magusensis]
MGGHKVDADAMASASKKMTEFAEDVTDGTKELEKSKITAKQFGEAHGTHAEIYTTSIATLSAAVKGYTTALSGFAANIAAGGQSYTANDQSQSGAMNQAGSN